ETEASVSYSSGRSPQILLDGKNHELLRALPEMELRLPGGRAVAVSVSFGYWDSTSYTTDMAALRKEVRKRQAKKAFDEWQQPSLEAPTGLEAEGAVVPQIREERIGTAFDGTPLVAYGALRHEYYSGSPLSTRWKDAHKEDATRIQFCQCHGELG